MAFINWLGAIAQQEGDDGLYKIYRWDIAGNWSCGSVPGGDDDVDILAGVPGAMIQTSAFAYAMIVEANQKLTIGAALDAAGSSYGAGQLSVSHSLTLNGELRVDGSDGDPGGSTLSAAGALVVGSTGLLAIGNAFLTATAKATFDSIVNAGVIAIEGGISALAKVVVNSAAGFGGQTGVLTGAVRLNGRALLDFAGGGGIDTIAAGATLTIDGPKAFLASGGAIGANTALKSRSAVYGGLTLTGGADVFSQGGISIGDGAVEATVKVDSGGTLHTFGAIAINARDELDIGALANAAVYARGGLQINGGTLNLGTGAIAGPILFSGAGGTLNLSGQTKTNVSGFNGTVNLTHSNIRLTGGGFTVNYLGASGNTAHLRDTGLAEDIVNAGNATVYLTNAAATISGANNTVFLIGKGDRAKLVNASGPLWDRVYGSNGEIDIESGFASVSGGGDVVRLTGANDKLRLLGTNGDADTVYADGRRIFLDGAQATVIGGGDTLSFVGPGDIVTLEETNGLADIVNGASGEINLWNAQATVKGSGQIVRFLGGSGNEVYFRSPGPATVYGSDGLIDVTNQQVLIAGGGDTIRVSSSSISLKDTDGKADSVTGNHSAIFLFGAQATVSGDQNSVYMDDGQGSIVTLLPANYLGNYVNTNNDIINLAGDLVTIAGTGNTVNFIPGSSNTVSLGAASGASFVATVNGSDGTIFTNVGGVTQINGDGNFIQMIQDDVFHVNGNRERIDVGIRCSIYLNGDNNVISTNELTNYSDIYGFNSTDSFQIAKSAFTDWQALQGGLVQSGADTLIKLRGYDLLILKNVDAASLSANEFHFL